MIQDWPGGGSGRMLELVVDFPDHLAAAQRLPGLDGVGGPLADGGRIVFCGMGGSAIAADLVQPLLAGGGIALTPWRDYGLPHWTTPDDVVIAASYSGGTEETLSALEAARELGCRVIGISAGGRLAELAVAEGFPRIELPAGLPPRAALGHGLGAVLHLLAALGAIEEPGEQIAAACDRLRSAIPSCLDPWRRNGVEPVAPAVDGPAVRELAGALQGRIPVLYSAGAEAHGVATRWKAQLNENAKIPVCVAAFPELDHNDLVGWNLDADLRRRFVLVILESGIPDPRARARIDATRDLLKDEFDSTHRISAHGDSPLQRVLSLVQYGDFLSCHLADLAGVDPMPVTRIDRLKTILSRSRTNSAPGVEPDQRNDNEQ